MYKALAILLLAAVAGLAALADGALTETIKVQSVVLATDGEGNVLPDAPITVTFNKRLPAGWLDRLHSDPPASFDLSVDTVGRWLGRTRLTINPSREAGFATATLYRFQFERARRGFSFETVPAPRILRVQLEGGLARATAPIVLVFDRPMERGDPARVTIDPEVPLDQLWYGDRALVLRHAELEPAEDYEIVVASGVSDAAGHAMWQPYRFRFRTAEPLYVTKYGPRGSDVSPSFPVRVTFSTGMDAKAVESTFSIDPPAAGTFEWPDRRTLVWRPEGLRTAQEYRVRVGGRSGDGDPIRPVEWGFRTIVPPPHVAPGGGGKVVLTFDDNPATYSEGERLLDALAESRVKAILFPTGAWAAANPDFVARALAEGHLICNHTYGHADLTQLSLEEMRFEILNGAGTDGCDLFRPPYGALDSRVEMIAASLGYRLFRWNVESNDWAGLSARQITANVLDAARPGAVIIFHMQARHTVEALPEIVQQLRRAGYVLSY